MGQYIYTFAVSQFNPNDDSVKRGEIKAEGAENKAPTPRNPPFMRKFDSDNNKINIIIKNKKTCGRL